MVIARANIEHYQRIRRKLRSREKMIFLMVDLSELFVVSCTV